MISEVLIIVLFSYIIGSIPFGVILARFFSLDDIRKIGSGNTGATNVLRTGNYTAAVLTLILDFSKACLAIYLTQMINGQLIFLSSLLILLGHIFPIWLNFSGGKGFASYLGIIFMVNFYLFSSIILVWILIYLVKRISSLSALISSFSSIVLSYFLFNSDELLIFMLTLIIFISHYENIKRLINGTESKIE